MAELRKIPPDKWTKSEFDVLAISCDVRQTPLDLLRVLPPPPSADPKLGRSASAKPLSGPKKSRCPPPGKFTMTAMERKDIKKLIEEYKARHEKPKTTVPEPRLVRNFLQENAASYKRSTPTTHLNSPTQPRLPAIPEELKPQINVFSDVRSLYLKEVQTMKKAARLPIK